MVIFLVTLADVCTVNAYWCWRPGYWDKFRKNLSSWRSSLLSVEHRATDTAEGFLLVLVLRLEIIRSGGTEKGCRSAFSLHVSLTRETLLVIGVAG